MTSQVSRNCVGRVTVKNIEQIYYTPSVVTRYLFEKVTIIHCIFLIYSEITVDNYE